MTINAKEIIKKYGIADSHFDLGGVLFNYIQTGEENPMKNILLPEWKEGFVKLVIGAIFIDSKYLPEKGLKMALDQLDIILNEIEKNRDEVALITKASDIDKAINSGKIGIILCLEGLEPIGEDLNLLNIFNRLGVKLAGLVWSRQNSVGDGSRFNGRQGNNGLTSFGFDVLEKMQELGMIVDISHLNDKGCEDVFANATNVIASHANARSVHNIKRNITDNQITAVKEKKGIIGINGTKLAIDGNFENMNEREIINAFCNHIDYYKKIIGTDSICLGLDKCNAFGEFSLRYGNQESESIDTFEKYFNIEIMVEELLCRGYEEDEIANILSANLLRYLKSNIQ